MKKIAIFSLFTIVVLGRLFESGASACGSIEWEGRCKKAGYSLITKFSIKRAALKGDDAWDEKWRELQKEADAKGDLPDKIVCSGIKAYESLDGDDDKAAAAKKRINSWLSARGADQTLLCRATPPSRLPAWMIEPPPGVQVLGDLMTLDPSVGIILVGGECTGTKDEQDACRCAKKCAHWNKGNDPSNKVKYELCYGRCIGEPRRATQAQVLACVLFSDHLISRSSPSGVARHRHSPSIPSH